MEVILLGTAGGPRPHAHRGAPAHAVTHRDETVIIDCGNGVARQAVRAGLDMATISKVFITHHHSDHNMDLGNLALLTWQSGRTAPIEIWGPPPIAAMIRAYLDFMAEDITARIASEERMPLKDLLIVREVSQPSVLIDQQDGLKVTAERVQHPPLRDSYAYRIDGAGGSVVISGDTAPCESLVRLADGADLLVHEVMHPEALAGMAKKLPNGDALVRLLAQCHTSFETVGELASAAGVRGLVLTHFVPSDPELVDEAAWVRPATRQFRGPVVLGRDLLRFELKSNSGLSIG